MDATGYKKPDTRNAILDAAQHYVQTSSYDGFSFRDVAQTVGIRKASVYHHFESKEALAVAMLDRSRDELRYWMATQSARPPAVRLRAYCLDLYRDRLGAGHNMCPAGSFVGGWSHITDAIRRSVKAVIDEQIDFVAAAMADGYADGSLRRVPGCEEREAALWFLTTVQGALTCSRVSEDKAKMFTRLCETTLASLEART